MPGFAATSKGAFQVNYLREQVRTPTLTMQSLFGEFMYIYIYISMYTCIWLHAEPPYPQPPEQRIAVEQIIYLIFTLRMLVIHLMVPSVLIGDNK